MPALTPRLKLGLRVRALRRERGLSRNELAYRVGIAVEHLEDVEKGRVSAGFDVVQRVADGLGVTLSYLFSDPVFDEPGPHAAAAGPCDPLPAGAGDVRDLLEMDVRTRRVLEALADEPEATYARLAGRLGVSRPTVAKEIARLKARGLLRREGNNRSGRWVVAGGSDEGGNPGGG